MQHPLAVCTWLEIHDGKVLDSLFKLSVAVVVSSTAMCLVKKGAVQLVAGVRQLVPSSLNVLQAML